VARARAGTKKKSRINETLMRLLIKRECYGNLELQPGVE
jgi:hypothetical protein